MNNKAVVNFLEAEDIHDGWLKVGKVTVEHELFNGGMSKPLVREMHCFSDAIAVLPYDPATNNVLLIEQFRPGAAIGGHPWQFEIIAGGIDGDESNEDACLREAKEEAGVDLIEVHPLTMCYNVAGSSQDKIYIHTAIADLSTAGSVHGLPEEGEDIRVDVMHISAALEMVTTGKIQHPSAIIALLWIKDKLNYSEQ